MQQKMSNVKKKFSGQFENTLMASERLPEAYPEPTKTSKTTIFANRSMFDLDV